MAAEAKGVLAKLRSGWRECWLNGKLELCDKELIHETNGELNERMRHYLPTFSPPASVLPKDLTARSWDGQFLDFYCPGNRLHKITPPHSNDPVQLRSSRVLSCQIPAVRCQAFKQTTVPRPAVFSTNLSWRWNFSML
jgi:hypothetical protein